MATWEIALASDALNVTVEEPHTTPHPTRLPRGSRPTTVAVSERVALTDHRSVWAKRWSRMTCARRTRRNPSVPCGRCRDWLYLAGSGAGDGARTRFNELARRWRRRALGRLRILTAVLLPVLFAAEVLERHLGAWAIGLATGGLVALYLSMRDEVPARIADWRRGYEGERSTAKVLAPYRRRGCVVLHDLPDRRTRQYNRGNVDHVLVSRAGVFLLDSKLLGGGVSVEGDVVHVQRLDEESASYQLNRLAPAMRGRAVRLREDIATATGVKLRVHAVVVLWCPFDAGVLVAGAVTYVHGERLAEWLDGCLAQPGADLRPQAVERIAAGIQQTRRREVRRRLPTLRPTRTRRAPSTRPGARHP